jgi:hypothetical protein
MEKFTEMTEVVPLPNKDSPRPAPVDTRGPPSLRLFLFHYSWSPSSECKFIPVPASMDGLRASLSPHMSHLPLKIFWANGCQVHKETDVRDNDELWLQYVRQPPYCAIVTYANRCIGERPPIGVLASSDSAYDGFQSARRLAHFPGHCKSRSVRGLRPMARRILRAATCLLLSIGPLASSLSSWQCSLLPESYFLNVVNEYDVFFKRSTRTYCLYRLAMRVV